MTKRIQLLTGLILTGILFGRTVLAHPPLQGCIPGAPTDHCEPIGNTVLCGCGTSGGGNNPSGTPENWPPGSGGGETPGSESPPEPGGTPTGWTPIISPLPAHAPGGTSHGFCWTCVSWSDCPSGWAQMCSIATLDTQWIHSWGCLSETACGGGEPPVSNQWHTPPCIPQYSGEEIILDCDEDCNTSFSWGYGINVWARVPPHEVEVDPFPRWLVAMGAVLPSPYESGRPGRLTLRDTPAYSPYPSHCGPNGPGDSEGCWSGAASMPTPARLEPQPGDVREYRIGLRWRRVRSDRPHPNDLGPAPAPCWTFDERSWNIGQDYGYGPVPNQICGPIRVEHIYETASWGKPHNGPRFLLPEAACGSGQNGCCAQVPNVWDMPAYQVRVDTTWAAEWRTRWETWEQVGVEWSDCQCLSEEPTDNPLREPCAPPAGICIGEGQWYGRIGKPQYDWVRHELGWTPFDLRAYGHPTWYWTSYQVITVGNGLWCPSEYRDPAPTDTVRVPVIEAQSVLRDPCIVTGNCPPGYP